MANIKAFKGIRPRKDLVEQVVAKPFDTFYTLAAKQILENNPISFLHTIEPLIANPFEQGSREEIVFKKEIDGVEKTSYAYRLVFQSNERTLTDEDANVIMNAIYTKIAELGWQVR